MKRDRLKRQATVFILTAICYLLSLSGCATVDYVKPVIPSSAGLPGITLHRVAKGETLWRISRVYGVGLEELTQVNRIDDNAAIEVGQSIIIPRAVIRAPDLKFRADEEFIWPLRGRIVGSFGQTIKNMVNKGINIAQEGPAQIAASRSGRVVFLGDNFAGLGKTLIIDHQDGFFTVYALVSEVFIRPGDNVQQGAIIARLGPPGGGGSSYLHFELRKGHLPQNPIFYLP